MTTPAEFAKLIWSNLSDAERALKAFAAAQGWSLHSRSFSNLDYTWRDAEGQQHVEQIVKYKSWGCSRGHAKDAVTPHVCGMNSSEAGHMSPCDQLNSTGQLAPTPDGTPLLPASAKTGCSVRIRISMIRAEKPEGNTGWTEKGAPCAGYHVSTRVEELQPCRHNHYSAVPPHAEQVLTESVSQISDDIREEIKTLVRSQFTSYRIRNFIAEKHHLPPMTNSVWWSLIRSLRRELGIQDAGDDLNVLIDRLTLERNERGAVFDMQVDSYADLTVSTIFFMSRDMISSFSRCGQFAVMDSTCKTNRFGLNLFLVCGVDEHQHISLFAAAFMKEETQPRFQYVLQQMKRAVGEEAWLRMTCVATDGCTAMTNALGEEASHAEQQRCVWHLQQNIVRHAGGAHHHIIKAWYACVYADTKESFEARWAELMSQQMGPKLSQYLQTRILPLAAKWAVYVTGCLTNFGSHSTQLVESLNNLLKMWDANDRTSLAQAVQRFCVVKDEELRRKQVTAMKNHAT